MARGMMFLLSICMFFLVNGASFAQPSMDDYYHLLYRYEGTKAYQKFGSGVYLAKDVNGDGYGDILIGASGEDVGNVKSAGRAYVYSGLDGSLLYSYSGENEYAFLGESLSDIEDTDGDGLSEILIGARGTDMQRGKVLHVSGVDGSVIREYWGETYTDSFGQDLEGLGDLDGDGYGDLVIGAPDYEDNHVLHRGAVYVYSGHSGLLKLKYEGTYTIENMGFKVCRVGWLNPDPWADFAYLTLHNKTGISPGGGLITVRSGYDGSLIKEICGRYPDYGIAVLEYGGDINNDGWPDLLAGHTTFKNGSLAYAGRAVVYSGKDWRELYVYLGQNKDGHLGGRMATAGDINCDGYCDFLIGAYGTNDLGYLGSGAVYVHSGLDGSLLGVVYGEGGNMYGMGISVHGGGDINADGLPDIIIGTLEYVGGISGVGSALVYTAKSLKATDEVPLGNDLELNLHVPAQPFGSYYLGFSLGADQGIHVGTRTLPLDWDLLFTLTFGNPLFSGALDGQGAKQILLPVPLDPALSGLAFYAAFLTLDPKAPKGVRTLSNPEKIVLQ